MKIVTIAPMSRLDRVFFSVVEKINNCHTPNLDVKEVRTFAIEGGTIRSLIDDACGFTVSLVDEMVWDAERKQFVEAKQITVYASKYDARGVLTPHRKWELNPDNINEIAFVIADSFLRHAHKLNLHYTGSALADELQIGPARATELIVAATDWTLTL